jgi:hypothetical protein
MISLCRVLLFLRWKLLVFVRRKQLLKKQQQTVFERKTKKIVLSVTIQKKRRNGSKYKEIERSSATEGKYNYKVVDIT